MNMMVMAGKAIIVPEQLINCNDAMQKYPNPMRLKQMLLKKLSISDKMFYNF